MYRLNEVFDVAHHRLKVKKRDNVLHAPTKLISRIICIAATKEFVMNLFKKRKYDQWMTWQEVLALFLTISNLVFVYMSFLYMF